MSRKKAIIVKIGVNDLDHKLLYSVVTLSPSLKQLFEPPGANETRAPDVVFVDADEALAMQAWQELSQRRPVVCPIMVSAAEQDPDTYIRITRPLTYKKIIYALEKAGSTSHQRRAERVRECKLRVLVVDDSLSLRLFMENKLMDLVSEPICLDFAASGEEAVHKFKNTGYPYDMVFLDVVMPGVDGYRVCKWIKANYPSKVVMLTSKKSPFDKVRGAMSGCDDYLTKPPDEARLKKILLKNIVAIEMQRPDAQTGGFNATQASAP